jgi:hypothetical protein
MDTYARTIRTHQQSLSLLLNEPRTATVIGTALQVRQLLDGVLEVAQDICRKPRLTLGMTYFQIVDVVTIETQTGKTQIIAFHKGSIRSDHHRSGLFQFFDFIINVEGIVAINRL